MFELDIVFLDASVLFSAAYRPEAKFLQLWKMRDVKLISSLYAAEEARRNLEHPDQRTRLEELLQSVELAPVRAIGPLPGEVKLPAKDEPILVGAIAAGAMHLLTSDLKHFGPYFGQIVAEVIILPPALYFERKSPAEFRCRLAPSDASFPERYNMSIP